MPQYANARVSFGDVLDAIAVQLVADGVAQSTDNVSYGTPSNHPVLVGASDVMLIARGGKHEPRDGGPAQFQVRRLVDVWVRSQNVLDPGVDLKSWIRAMFVTGDQILDSVGDDGFQPEDDDGNLLTVEAIQMVEDSPPDYKISGSVYGELACTLSAIYLPAIDPTKGIFPMP